MEKYSARHKPIRRQSVKEMGKGTGLVEAREQGRRSYVKGAVLGKRRTWTKT